MGCPKCGGTGFIDRGGVLELCACRYEGVNLQKYLNIPVRFINSEFENYIPVSPSQRRALEVCLHYAQEFDPKSGKGLSLIGPPQMGKTHLAVAVLKYVYRQKRIRGFFFDTKDLFYRLRQYSDISQEKYHKLMRLVLNTPLLVLDDLGSERLSDWRIEVLSHIISHRYNFLKSTIITTNYSLLRQGEEVAKALEERLSPAIVGKIYQMNELIDMSYEELKK
ncbi:MAG: ATP-binding protein [Aquificaceae bacterium]|nr:ATP-binding protein [Aquificaceae bacterium]MDW8067149.1 ATP-binding protein [Aquificaceae bacterium]MDW8422956.1 ATP-binding protein [Aquificaceae bacterium]